MPDSTISIRAATEADVPLILRFIRALAEYEREPDAVVATHDDLQRWLFGEKPAAEVVFAQVDDREAGFALFFPNFSTWLGRPGLYLEDLFVLPEYRRRGIGRELLAHLARIAIERGYGRVEWAVLDWNEPAIGFYKRLGARAMDEWTTYRLDGEALLRLVSGEPKA
jgi:ribosomal protein S18 acetylase RimI-like enzyme